MSSLDSLFTNRPTQQRPATLDIPFFAPVLPTDEVLDFLDEQKNRIETMLRQGAPQQAVEQTFTQSIYQAFVVPQAPYSDLLFVRQTPSTVMWRNPDCGVEGTVAANLWLQPMADPHADAKLSVLTMVDPLTRELRVLMSDEMDVVIFHRRHEVDGFKSLDVVRGEDRIMGAPGAIAGKLTIPAAYMSSRVETIRDELGIGFRCTHSRLRGRGVGTPTYVPVT